MRLKSDSIRFDLMSDIWNHSRSVSLHLQMIFDINKRGELSSRLHWIYYNLSSIGYSRNHRSIAIHRDDMYLIYKCSIELLSIFLI